ncbi:hypothetical protein DEU56DRAFT_352954 [Suillus clintonianus]|uniref:uncharacterized protein n=1 Tax=Suillus clintonianus TaxID=1904413 RepID=UPI001B878707|nr:uncharacterized protein DEU56DRAFT_352954 [Suillus clintonianus]KAG2137003.1 hypothetical protein DEU56DRAFT_352954 [Suillus clintonianus]
MIGSFLSTPAWCIAYMFDTMIGNANTTSQICTGGIFDIGIGSTPAWIDGNTLKNVYSVFHASPTAVGFTQLASGLSSSAGLSDSNPVQVTGLTPLPTSTCVSLEWERKHDERQHTLCICFFQQEHRPIAYSSRLCDRLLHPLPLSRGNVLYDV